MFLLLYFYSTGVLAQSSIVVDPSTGRITVRAPRGQMRQVEEMISGFPGQIQQIEVSARILELSEKATQKFGAYLERLTGLEVPIGSLGEGSHLTYGPKSLTEIGEEIGSIMIDFYRTMAEEKFEVILNALLSQGEARILSSPRITTMSGQVAGMYVTSDIPYVSSITYREVGGEEVKHYSYSTVGIILQVLPKIIAPDRIQMSIVPIVGNYEIDPDFGVENPVFKRQVSPTNVVVKDGESVVIGGLITENKTFRSTGLPIISDLPLIGNLFKSRTETTEKRNLLITVKPRIIRAREIEGRTKKVFTFKYALAEEVANQIHPLVSSEGLVEINPAEAPPNSLLVREKEDRMQIIEKMVNHIGAYESQKRQKQLLLQFTSLGEADISLKPFLSSHGSIQIDPETHSLIIEDGACQLAHLERALSSLESHNKIPRTKIFHLEYVGPEEIIPSLEKYLSPRGFIEVRGESLVVTDNNWVIYKIAEEIAKLP